MRLKNALNLARAQLATIVQGIERVSKRLLTARAAIPLMPTACFTMFMRFRMLTKPTFHLPSSLFNAPSSAKPLFFEA
jgi:hypothetical protein